MGVAVDPEDLTARARIRDAALRQFGEHGFERSTIRGIAEAAGVSSGLVRHHFGSKQALREACDEYVLRSVRKLNDETWAAAKAGDLRTAAASRVPIGPYGQYVIRSLVDGGADALFDEMTRMSESWIAVADAQRDDEPAADVRTRAAVVTAMALGVPILHAHLSRALGADVSTADGDRLLALALVDLYSRPLMSPADAEAARAGLNREDKRDE
jgi:AcrR family transcriptional regulator